MEVDPMKYAQIRLMTQNFDETFDFYNKGLGLPVTWGRKGDVYASFRTENSVELAIFQADLMESHIGYVTEERSKIHDKIMLSFAVDDLDRCYQEFLSKGITCINEPRDMPAWGIRCLHLRDPEGNLIEVNQELPKHKWSDDLREDADKYGH
jgi:lactoylglutathione lyase